MSGIPSGIPFVKAFKKITTLLNIFLIQIQFWKAQTKWNQGKIQTHHDVCIKIIIFNFFDL